MPTLTDFATIKALLGMSQSDVSDYSGLSEIMDSVDAAISNYLQRELTSASRSESVHIAQASKIVSLPGLPVASVSSITTTAIGGDAVSLASTEYQITDFGLRLFSAVENSLVSVTYTGGPAAVPSAWARAAEIQIRHEWQSREHVAADRVSNDGGSVSRPGLVLLDEVMRLLNPDRHPLLAVM